MALTDTLSKEALMEIPLELHLTVRRARKRCNRGKYLVQASASNMSIK